MPEKLERVGPDPNQIPDQRVRTAINLVMVEVNMVKERLTEIEKSIQYMLDRLDKVESNNTASTSPVSGAALSALRTEKE